MVMKSEDSKPNIFMFIILLRKNFKSFLERPSAIFSRYRSFPDPPTIKESQMRHKSIKLVNDNEVNRYQR